LNDIGHWSGVAGTATWSLDPCGFAVVDMVNNKDFHLIASAFAINPNNQNIIKELLNYSNIAT